MSINIYIYICTILVAHKLSCAHSWSSTHLDCAQSFLQSQSLGAQPKSVRNPIVFAIKRVRNPSVAQQ